jgi:hypothetical protein
MGKRKRTVAPVLERQESSTDLGIKATTEVENFCISKTWPDFVPNSVPGISLSSSPPITVLINNLNLEGNEWLEALKNMSLSTNSSQLASRPLVTLEIDSLDD